MVALKIVALVTAISATSLASDVYSDFFDSNGNSVTSGVNFDTHNRGCFYLQNAAEVTFSQGGIHGSTADGPYCLTGYSDGCSSVTGRQQFQNVKLEGARVYHLAGGVAGAHAYSWAPNGC